MACDYFQVPIENIRMKMGEYVEIPNASMPDGSRKNVRIPVNARGEMIINWAGDYKDAFRHFPYSSLPRLAEQHTLEEMKRFLSAQDSSIFREPGRLLATVYEAFPDERQFATYVAYLYGAHWYETLIQEGAVDSFGPELFGQLFGLSETDDPILYESQKEVFENVRLNHAMLRLFSEKPSASLLEAAVMLNISEEDAEDSYVVVKELLVKGGPTASDRPLFFASPIVVDGKTISLGDLSGGVFFYGLTAAGTHDLNPMPFSPRYPMVGALANVFNTIVTEQFIVNLEGYWRLPLFLAVGLFAGYILSSRTTIRGSLFTILFLIAYLLLAYWLFASRGVWIDVVGPAGIILATDAAIVWYKFSTAEKKRKFIKSAFEHYMNPKVVDQIAKNPEMLGLGGKEMVLTAFFSDVAGFTTISEQLTPHELVELLNEYLTAMTDIVFKYDGLLDKYEGDAIMAVFGAPIHFPDHATKACYASLEMQAELKRLREKWKSENRPELRARIGLNTGAMIVGNMGSRTRFDYTVMGDSVNLASRLEGVNKQYSTEIMISEFTLEHCKSDVVVREVDLIRVKGKTAPVRIYEVLGRADDGLPEELKKAVEYYMRGLGAYRSQQWQAGIEEFRRVLEMRPDDGPSLTYLKRCNEYIAAPPPEDWDGVYVMTTK
jgi:class 3 adenylate cyclase